uniref:3-hydroxyanthranilate 3,4-dioxygenase n=1 Tax=Oncorhynchus kisutch TaxID=8019 RepID=A0A8C7CG96_ONCKI
MSGKPLLVNVDKWIAENEKAFLPPVCNKLTHFCQLYIMLVGGPNTSIAFHCHVLFLSCFVQLYSVEGDICLKVVENGKHKFNLTFLLLAQIPHSPQRLDNTVGLVLERRRLHSKTDCLRYHHPPLRVAHYFYFLCGFTSGLWIFCCASVSHDTRTLLANVLSFSVCLDFRQPQNTLAQFETEFPQSTGDSLLIPGHMEGRICLFVTQNPGRRRA